MNPFVGRYSALDLALVLLGGVIIGLALPYAVARICAIFNGVEEAIQRRKEKRRGYIAFGNSNDPPDQGLDQRIYKPKGTPAKVHKDAVRDQQPRHRKAK